MSGGIESSQKVKGGTFGINHTFFPITRKIQNFTNKFNINLI